MKSSSNVLESKTAAGAWAVRFCAGGCAARLKESSVQPMGCTSEEVTNCLFRVVARFLCFGVVSIINWLIRRRVDYIVVRRQQESLHSGDNRLIL